MKATYLSRSEAAALGLLLTCLLQACGNSDSSGKTTLETATGGMSTVPGSLTSVGGSGAGGAGNSGGVAGTLTAADQGGVGTIDVTSHTGGQTSSSSGLTGGVAATGGRAATGGSSLTGGAAATGGRAATGGSSLTGGATATGGSSLTGGAAATGGRAATGGSAATGGTTSNAPVSSVDILYMIDNSSSMADKQQVLAASLPQLLAQLAQPNCVDSSGQSLGASQLTQTGPSCTTGTLEFKAINDIHIGIVTSSLGDHGAGAICTPGASTPYTDPNTGNPIVQPPDVNDMGRLLGTTTRGSQALQQDTAIVQDSNVSLDPKGFLSWGAPSLSSFPTSADLNSATAAFKDMVVATGQIGCGFESQLESWFRFLIDPVPPVYPIVRDAQNMTSRTGVDDALLAQRAAFLRPNSLLLIVMLTDENDCSIRDTDVGWVAAVTTSSIPTGSPACATNPNDRCCYSCSAAAPSGCSACPSSSAIAPDDSAYQANIRCWEQKRRFGYSFLYPTSRYYVGLTHTELCPDQTFGDMDCDCVYANSLGASCSPGTRRLPNPIYSQVVGTDSQGNSVMATASGSARADSSNVFLAGIIGVPWQDVSEPNSQGAGANLMYIPVTDARWSGSGGIWSQLYGDDDLNIAPGDIHMVESLVPRTGLPGPTTSMPTADPKNGHEYNTAREDLEYACIFALEGAAPARPCACTQGSANYASCKYLNPNDCCDLSYTADGAGGPGASYDKPLCQNPTTGAYDNTQYYAKGYPSLREIAVLHDYAAGPANYTDRAGTGNSIVTSICPKVLTAGQEASPGYGYNPVARAIIERLKDRLQN